MAFGRVALTTACRNLVRGETGGDAAGRPDLAPPGETSSAVTRNTATTRPGPPTRVGDETGRTALSADDPAAVRTVDDDLLARHGHTAAVPGRRGGAGLGLRITQLRAITDAR